MTLFLDALAGKTTPRPPFWFMRQAGRYLPEYRAIRANAPDFVSFCLNPELAAEVTLQPIRRFEMDAAILFADILLIPHALGQPVRFIEGEGPKLTPIASAGDIAALRFQPEMLAPVYETVKRVRAALDGKTTLIGFAGSPWTVACYMCEGGGSREFATARRFAVAQPKAFAELIDTITEATITYLSAQIEAGAQALQLFDSHAGVAPEAEFRAHVIAPTARIVQQLHKRFPHVPIIGFPRGGGAFAAQYASQTQVQGISLDYTFPLSGVSHLPANVTLQGNLDPILLADDIEGALAQSQRIIDAWGTRPFIFNLGHGMLPHTPVEHMQRLCEFLQNCHSTRRATHAA